jgi:hypothetical protein
MFPDKAADQFVDYSNPSTVRLIVDDTRGVAVIYQEMYKWAFEVNVPDVMPTENVWYVSVCGSGECRNITTDPMSVIPLTFPVPGFAIGQVSTKPLYPSGSVVPGWGISVVIAIVALLFAS